MRVVLSGKIRASKQGTWVIGNGRAGLVFDARYATGRAGDPAVVPEAVRECVSAEFVSVIELSLESGDECWLRPLCPFVHCVETSVMTLHMCVHAYNRRDSRPRSPCRLYCRIAHS